MTPKQFDRAYQSFCNIRPPRKFRIEFASGGITPVPHPEAVRRKAIYALRLCLTAPMWFSRRKALRVWIFPSPRPPHRKTPITGK